MGFAEDRPQTEGYGDFIDDYNNNNSNNYTARPKRDFYRVTRTRPPPPGFMFFKYFFLFFFAFFPSRYYCRRYITHNRRGRPYIYSVALLSLQYRLVWRSSRTRGRPEFLFVENKTRGENLPATHLPLP